MCGVQLLRVQARCRRRCLIKLKAATKEGHRVPHILECNWLNQSFIQSWINSSGHFPRQPSFFPAALCTGLGPIFKGKCNLQRKNHLYLFTSHKKTKISSHHTISLSQICYQLIIRMLLMGKRILVQWILGEPCLSLMMARELILLLCSIQAKCMINGQKQNQWCFWM